MIEPDDPSILLDHLRLIEALYAIALESDEAETVRNAFAALSSTDSGRNYLAQHPVEVG